MYGVCFDTVHMHVLNQHKCSTESVMYNLWGHSQRKQSECTWYKMTYNFFFSFQLKFKKRARKLHLYLRLHAQDLTSVEKVASPLNIWDAPAA